MFNTTRRSDVLRLIPRDAGHSRAPQPDRDCAESQSQQVRHNDTVGKIGYDSSFRRFCGWSATQTRTPAVGLFWRMTQGSPTLRASPGLSDGIPLGFGLKACFVKKAEWTMRQNALEIRKVGDVTCPRL